MRPPARTPACSGSLVLRDHSSPTKVLDGSVIHPTDATDTCSAKSATVCSEVSATCAMRDIVKCPAPSVGMCSEKGDPSRPGEDAWVAADKTSTTRPSSEGRSRGLGLQASLITYLKWLAVIVLVIGKENMVAFLLAFTLHMYTNSRYIILITE